MPHLLQIAAEKDKKDYLTHLYDELYLKDIVERNHIEREDVMKELLDYLASQVGFLTNASNIANALTSNRHENINSVLVSSYIRHITDCFLIRVARRYDVKGKSYFDYPNKYYYCDIGLRNARLNYRQYDPGHIMENIICNELIRRGYSVNVGVVVDRKSGAKVQREIYFVVNDGDRRIYIQSALQIDSEEKEQKNGNNNVKFVSLETAGRMVQSGDWVDYGFGAGFPELLDRALAAQKRQIKDVKIRGGLVIRSRIEVVESDPGQESFSFYN